MDTLDVALSVEPCNRNGVDKRTEPLHYLEVSYKGFRLCTHRRQSTPEIKYKITACD